MKTSNILLKAKITRTIGMEMHLRKVSCTFQIDSCRIFDPITQARKAPPNKIQFCLELPDAKFLAALAGSKEVLLTGTYDQTQKMVVVSHKRDFVISY